MNAAYQTLAKAESGRRLLVEMRDQLETTMAEGRRTFEEAERNALAMIEEINEALSQVAA